MAQSLILAGAHIQLYINNKLYKTVQSIVLNVDYGEVPIYGIDSEYAQELAPTKVMISGSVTGLRVKYSGGIQANNMRPLWNDVAASPYISLRIHDLSTGEDIILIQNCKVTKETHTAAIRGTYKLNFDFIGMVPLWALDRS
jgi:hypothetical protein